MSKKNKNKNKKPNFQFQSLNNRFLQKKIDKAVKQGQQLFRCVGGCHMPNGCGHQFTNIDGHTICPKCHNQYCLWINAPE
jgi:hypothetical protein